MVEQIALGNHFDVVAISGIFYHITEHYRLVTLAAQLRPNLMIIDSEFLSQSGPIIRFSREQTSKDMNST